MDFGNYFKKLRKSKKVTQKQVATAIGKTEMLISGVESNKNGSFMDEDLKKIIECLNLSESEGKELQIQAAKARGTLPTYMLAYVLSHGGVYELIDVLVENRLDEEKIKLIKQYAEGLKC